VTTKPRQAADPVLLVGTPDALEGIVRLPTDVPHYLLEVRADDRPEVATVSSQGLRVRAFPAGGDRARVRVRVDPSTPPGRYPVVLSVGSGSISADLLVQEAAKLTVAPRELLVRGTGSSRHAVETVFTNLGNVPIEIRRSHLVGISEDGSLEAAFADAVSPPELPAARRLDLFANAVARRHGGFLSITVGVDGLTVRPAETVRPSVEIRLPDGLSPEHTYFGAWQVTSGARIPIHVQVDAAPRPAAKRSAPTKRGSQ
jgi:hypothetical protein